MRSQVILISGCSSGFGLLTAVHAATRGHTVVATLRDLSKRAALDQAAQEAGVSLDVRALDVDRADSIRETVAGVLEKHGRVDTLINNAGFAMGGTVHDLSMEDLRAQLETNFFGAVALTKAVLPDMLQRRSGRVLQVSSIASHHGAPGLGAYAASKRALDGITESLRLELAPHGVQVGCVHPGFFRTAIYRKTRFATRFDDAASPFHGLSQGGRSMVARVNKSLAGDPAVVARLLVRLLERRRLPAHVVVGLDAHAMDLARAVLPERAWEQVVRRVMAR